MLICLTNFLQANADYLLPRRVEEVNERQCSAALRSRGNVNDDCFYSMPPFKPPNGNATADNQFYVVAQVGTLRGRLWLEMELASVRLSPAVF